MTKKENGIKPTKIIQNFISSKSIYSMPSQQENNNLIYLDKNENPYIPPLDDVSFVLLNLLKTYPDPNSTVFLNSLSKLLNIPPTFLLAGSGSDELLDLIFKTYTTSKTKILSINPTFSMYKFYAGLKGAKYESIPLDIIINRQTGLAKFELDQNKFMQKAKSSNIIILARPNNPDGMIISKEYIIKLLDLNKLMIIDEAYIDFSEKMSLIDQMNNYENLILLRSLSKSFSLAGLRLGYMIAHPSIINILSKVKSPFNVNKMAQILATELLNNYDKVLSNVQKIQLIRNQFFTDLFNLQEKFKSFYIHNSEANFILLRFKSTELATAIYQHFLENSVLVRKFQDNLSNCLRISIGTEIQMKKVVDLLLNYLEGK